MSPERNFIIGWTEIIRIKDPVIFKSSHELDVAFKGTEADIETGPL